MRAVEIRLIHRGEFMCYYEIDYEDESGNSKTYEMVSKAGSKHTKTPDLTLESIGNNSLAVIMLIFDKTHEKMLLSREFRMGVNHYVYNDIAGLIDPGEEAVARELKEETGLDLVRIVARLNPTYTCAPVTDDVTTLFIVEADGELTGSNSVYEEIESKWCTKEEVIELLEDTNNRFAGRMQALAYSWAHGGLI